MATIQEILEMNQGGASQASSDVRFLIQSIRDKMQRAKEEDAIRAESWRSGGKAGLNSLKARRDFLLAKRGNPNLKFMDFMSDPKTSAKYMTQGTDAIVGGKSPELSLKEVFGFGRGDDYIDTVRQKGGLKALSSGDTISYPNPNDIAKPTGVPVSPSGLVPDFGASAISEGVLPQGVQRVAGNQASQNVIQQAMDEARLRLGAQKVSQAVPSQVPSETGASTGTMGTAGKALGALGGAYSLGTGLQDIAKGKGDLSTVAKTASGGAGILSALGMMNPMVGLGLGALSMLSRRR
jgi:hypothetical protein